MDVIKVSKTEGNFVMMYNGVFREKDLSLRAKGMLATIMSLPPSWDFSIKGLSCILKEGRDAIYSTINELIEKSYCVRYEIKDNGKIKGTEYHFCEKSGDLGTFQPYPEKPYTESPDTENPTQYNIQVNKSEKSNIEEKTNKVCSKEPKDPKIHYADFVTMTEKEHDNLVRDYGTKNTEWMINKLNNYKGAKGITYKSDYLATLNWVVGECAKAQGLAELPKIDHRPDWQKAGASSEEEYNLFAHRQ